MSMTEFRKHRTMQNSDGEKNPTKFRQNGLSVLCSWYPQTAHDNCYLVHSNIPTYLGRTVLQRCGVKNRSQQLKC